MLPLNTMSVVLDRIRIKAKLVRCDAEQCEARRSNESVFWAENTQDRSQRRVQQLSLVMIVDGKGGVSGWIACFWTELNRNEKLLDETY